MTNAYHIPVLLKESVDGLQIKKNGIYVDATFGAGGHSKEILNRLKSGRLIAFDKDADSLSNVPENENLTLVNHDFIYMENFLHYFGIEKTDGILADLGISSHQVDTAERGFSFRYDADLDMRMDKNNPLTAEIILNTYNADRLQQLFSKYGEVRNAKTLALAIVSRRKSQRITTTGALSELAEQVMPVKENIRKYLSPIYQALRIEVNNELEGLKAFLKQCYDSLAKGGRMVVITYHSLEDRIVKNFIAQTESEGTSVQRDVYGNISGMKWNQLTRKPIIATSAEIDLNPRSRSAKLRIAEKL